MGAPGRLQVDRFRAEYVVPADHPAPGALRARLDAAARAGVARALGDALSRTFGPDDASVWLIRRLHVDVHLEEAWDDADIARLWAARAVRALASKLAAAETSPTEGDVLHFPDRPAYLARFLADLSAGDAWDRWYHAPFEGLRPLPVSAALRTALLEHPDQGLAALLGLHGAERARVLAALRPGDARRVLDGLPPGASPHPPTAWDALWRAWESLPPHSLRADDEVRAALDLWLRADAAGLEARGAARALARLARLLGTLRPPALSRLLRALRSETGGALLATAPADADALAPLRESPPGWVEAVARTLSATEPAPEPELEPAAEAAGASPARGARATAFGAAFALLPFLDALPLDVAADGWPAAGATPAPAALRLLLACKALGAPRAARAFWDPVLRDALGVPPQLTPAVVRGWARALPRGALPRLLHALALHRVERGHVSGHTLALWSAPLPAAPAALLLDLPTGLWLWAHRYAPGRAGATAARAAAWLDAVGIRPETVLADAAFDEIARVLPGAPRLAAARLEADARLAAVLARRPQLDGDLAHLAAPTLGLPRAVDLALSVAAQSMLREYAGRIRGFAASSLPYLYTQFLDVPAVVEVEPERWVARLGRPPLQLILQASGLVRGECHARWLPRPILLCQAEDA